MKKRWIRFTIKLVMLCAAAWFLHNVTTHVMDLYIGISLLIFINDIPTVERDSE